MQFDGVLNKLSTLSFFLKKISSTKFQPTSTLVDHEAVDEGPVDTSTGCLSMSSMKIAAPPYNGHSSGSHIILLNSRPADERAR